jgi:predicted DNA-binding transcriptional regulator YafY
MDSAGVLALLRDAASRRSPMWVGYVDSAGHPSSRLVEPLRLEGGRITAFDRGSEQVRTIPVSHVTGVAPFSPAAGT